MEQEKNKEQKEIVELNLKTRRTNSWNKINKSLYISNKNLKLIFW
jgi:hypothetical protein